MLRAEGGAMPTLPGCHHYGFNDIDKDKDGIPDWVEAIAAAFRDADSGTYQCIRSYLYRICE